eukprot:7468067-Lingulodinium_polyedra.AAC.1
MHGHCNCLHNHLRGSIQIKGIYQPWWTATTNLHNIQPTATLSKAHDLRAAPTHMHTSAAPRPQQ